MLAKFRFCTIAALVVAFFVLIAPAAAQSFLAPPSGYQFTLMGCRNSGQTPLYSNTTLPLLCSTVPSDPYTSGNLGKGWNELDLVPFSLIIKSTDYAVYNIYLGGDLSLGSTNCGNPQNNPGTVACGWDLLTEPVVDISTAGACSVVSNAQEPLAGVTGGSAYTMMRRLTITQNENSTCILNWDQRLALGARFYPGSSLQAYMFQNVNFHVGKKTVPLPVNGIKAPAAAKTMSATQDQNVSWEIAKVVDPTELKFGNTCDVATPLSKAVQTTVTWTRHDPTPVGLINLLTDVTLTNNASRQLVFNISDQVYTDTTPVGGPQSGTLTLDALSSGVKELSGTAPSGSTKLNDIATVTITDALTGYPVPGTLSATAKADVGIGTVSHDTAAVYDDMSLTGALYMYSVDSMVNNLGTLSEGTHTLPSGPYTAATKVTIPLMWNSGSVSTSGSETLKQTVYINGPGTNHAGTLNDQAFLKLDETSYMNSPILTVDLSAHPLVTINIKKTITGMPAGMEQTFTYRVMDSASPANEVATKTLTFSTKGTQTIAVPSLEPGTYTVKEDAVTGWTRNPASLQATADASTMASCSAPAEFTNTFLGQDLTISKTVNPKFRRTYHWNITKQVVGDDTKTGRIGEQLTFNYNVTASETGFIDDQWAAAGDITVHNPNAYDITGVTVTDSLCTISGGTGLTIKAGQDAVIPYSCTMASGAGGTNTATATWDAATNFTPSGTAASSADYSFATPTSRRVCNPTDMTCVAGNLVTVTDTFNTGTPKQLGTLTANDTTPYATATWQTTSTVTVVSGCKSYDNYGKIVETTQQAKATVQVCGYSGEVAPTQTTCAQFVQGTNLQQSGINYSVSGGVIAQNLNPGVFFYFSRVIPSVNGVQRITVTEANNGAPGNYNFAVQQVQLFTAACGSMRFVAGGNGATAVTLDANLRKDVPYIIAVKYDSKSIAGRPAPSTDPVYYSFGTFLGATQADANANAFVLTKGPVGTY
ncbi:MAG TPA: hypothetical protein VKB58_10510 [Terriglobales bacterium]|nr:hypothetical protein [Terriglobales bacterium]